MPIEPQLFLSYGRPDKDLAFQITAGLWDQRIDCYNYLAKPVMERLGGDGDHSKYLNSVRFFVAVMSADTLWRELVVKEHADVRRLTQARLRDIPSVYVTTDAILQSGPYPTGDALDVIDPTRSSGVDAIVGEILRLMGPDLIGGSQARWDINKRLYPQEWQAVDAALVAGRGDPHALPDAKALMVREVTDRYLEHALRHELAGIRDDANRWFFLLCLAAVVEFGGLPMGEELRHLVPRLVRLGHQAPEVRQALNSRLEPLADGPLTDVASVIGALRQIERSLDWMRCSEALAIARRVTWPLTRRLAMCSVYYAASGVADEATRREICGDLGLLER